MDHALVGANERFKSRWIAIPALQHPDLFLIRVAHAASFYPIGQSGTTSPLNFLRGLPAHNLKGENQCVFMTPRERFFKDNSPLRSRFRVSTHTHMGVLI